MWNELMKWAEEKQTVVVDVDGTIFTYERYEKNKFGEPIDEVLSKLKELKDKGIKLILSTARGEDEQEALEKHLKDNGLENLFDKVICGQKERALAYVDDRSINPLKLEVWKNDLDELLKEK